ncbi:MAG: GYD domain-containing protein [candidate division Zixibacteria bacterium]|nr:GYD domain-containing protein [candidate division Zixibacteria bacterium]
MKTFVLMTKLARRDAPLTEIGAKLADRSRTGRAWLTEIKEKCPEITFKAHYALMGYWDSMHIYEAPDEEAAAKVSLLTRPYAAQVESWLALPYEKVLKISEEIQSPEEDQKP